MSNLREIAKSRIEEYVLPIESISIEEGFNFRHDTPKFREGLEELARSIAANGIKNPLTIVLKDGIPVLRDGHRRIMATEIANEKYGAEIDSVPCRLEDKFANDLDQTFSLFTRNDQTPPTMLEQADLAKRILSFGKTPEDIVTRTGKSISHVNNLILLCSATEKVREMIMNDQISPSTVIEAIRKYGDKTEDVLVKANESVEVSNTETGKKKKVTDKTVKTGKHKTDWKVWGPKFEEMLHIICHSAETEGVLKANLEDARALLIEFNLQERK